VARGGKVKLDLLIGLISARLIEAPVTLIMHQNYVSLSEIIKPSSKIKVIDVGASLLEAPLYMPLIESGLAALVAFEPDHAECQRLNDLWG